MSKSFKQKQNEFHQIEDKNDDEFKGKTTASKEDYRIAICQDGKFAVTFDTGKKTIRRK